MAATYDPTLPTDKDWVRFLIGDRDVTTARFADEEYVAVLTEEANKYLAAARMAETLLGRSGGLVEKEVDTLRLKWSDTAQNAYREYIDELRKRGCELLISKPNRVFRVL